MCPSPSYGPEYMTGPLGAIQSERGRWGRGKFNKTDRQIDTQTYRHTERHTNRQTDRQTYR